MSAWWWGVTSLLSWRLSHPLTPPTTTLIHLQGGVYLKQKGCWIWSSTKGTHCIGKTGKMAHINPCQGKDREFGNFAKTQGIWFAQNVNSLILKVKDISIFATKISLPSQFCVCNSHKSRKLAQGKFAFIQGKHREFENAIWVGTLRIWGVAVQMLENNVGPSTNGWRFKIQADDFC